MFMMEHRGVSIICPNEISKEEAVEYVEQELCINPKLKLTHLGITLSDDEKSVELQPVYDTITRVRRITGYLSTIPKFNDAKRAEERARIAHIDFE